MFLPSRYTLRRVPTVRHPARIEIDHDELQRRIYKDDFCGNRLEL